MVCCERAVSGPHACRGSSPPSSTSGRSSRGPPPVSFGCARTVERRRPRHPRHTFADDISRRRRPLRPMQYRRTGRSGPQAARDLAWALAQLRRDRPLETQPRHPAARVRPRRHALRPGEQLRPAVRLGRGELRPHPRAGLPAVPRRADDLDQGRVRHVAGPVRRVGLAEVPARLARPVARAGWASSTSTSSTRTGSTPTRRSRRRWARCDTAVRSGKALYAGISSYSAERTARGGADPARSSARRC